LSPDHPFPIGLRLSDRASRELLAANRLAEFIEFLKSTGLFVQLLNGYPYGPFHGTPVKDEVFLPDWRTEERVEYTLRLVQVLRAILPRGLDGGISTVPLSYKPWIHEDDRASRMTMVRNLTRVAAALIGADRDGGQKIRLEIEPEPDGLIENSGEVISFFHDWLLPHGSAELAAALCISREDAERKMREHICVCFDTCHFAVEFEDAGTALGALAAAEIRVGRMQLSSALAVSLPAEDIATRLRPFADSVYLHQVVERRPDGSMRRFRDLADALAAAPDRQPREWRIHFHVPLFASSYGTLGSTQNYLAGILRQQLREPFTSHLEIETYTWDVLPAELKLGLVDSIEREYRWVLDKTCARQPF
jgi:sugar phosphate isomerase/epimerase